MIEPQQDGQRRPTSSWNSFAVLGAGLLVGLGLGLILLFVWGPGQGWIQDWITQDQAVLMPEVGALAPNVPLTSLDGQSSSIKDYRGRIVLLNFWATWCVPCQVEMPIIQDFADRHPQQMAVLAVNVDESPEVVQEFVNKLALHFQIVMDPGGEITAIYKVRGFPTTYFIDQDGIIRFQHIGVLNANQVAEYLRQLGVEQ